VQPPTKDTANAADEPVMSAIRDGYRRVMNAKKLNPHSFSQTSLEVFYLYMLDFEKNYIEQHGSIGKYSLLLQVAETATEEYPLNEELWDALESGYAASGDASAAGLVRWKRNKKMASASAIEAR
jgi:hypothetical protein